MPAETLFTLVRALEEKLCLHFGSANECNIVGNLIFYVQNLVWFKTSKLTLNITSYAYIIKFSPGDMSWTTLGTYYHLLDFQPKSIQIQAMALDDVAGDIDHGRPLQLLSIYQ